MKSVEDGCGHLRCSTKSTLTPRKCPFGLAELPSPTASLQCSTASTFGESCPDARIKFFRQRTDVCPVKNRRVRAWDVVNIHPVLCVRTPAVIGGMFVAIVTGMLRSKERNPSRVDARPIRGDCAHERHFHVYPALFG